MSLHCIASSSQTCLCSIASTIRQDSTGATALDSELVSSLITGCCRCPAVSGLRNPHNSRLPFSAHTPCQHRLSPIERAQQSQLRIARSPSRRVHPSTAAVVVVRRARRALLLPRRRLRAGSRGTRERAAARRPLRLERRHRHRRHRPAAQLHGHAAAGVLQPPRRAAAGRQVAQERAIQRQQRAVVVVVVSGPKARPLRQAQMLRTAGSGQRTAGAVALILICLH